MRRAGMAVALALVCAAWARGQTAAQPGYLVTIGAGFNEASDPHYMATGSFGARIGDGLYSITSLDTGTTYDAAKQARALVSTLRTGLLKTLAASGRMSLAAQGDAGVESGGPATAGAFSAGVVVAYTFRRQPNAFAFVSVGIQKVAGSVAGAGGAPVLAAFSFGVGWGFE